MLVNSQGYNCRKQIESEGPNSGALRRKKIFGSHVSNLTMFTSFCRTIAVKLPMMNLHHGHHLYLAPLLGLTVDPVGISSRFLASEKSGLSHRVLCVSLSFRNNKSICEW